MIKAGEQFIWHVSGKFNGSVAVCTRFIFGEWNFDIYRDPRKSLVATMDMTNSDLKDALTSKNLEKIDDTHESYIHHIRIN